MSELWNALTVWQQTGVAVAAAFLLHLFIKLIVLRGLDRVAGSTENDLDDRLVHFFTRFYLFILLSALLLVVLRIHGIKITPFLASAGIAGIAIGLAAKETLSDILAGIFLIADRPIRIGDRVKIESIGTHWGGWGDVLDVGLRRTRVRNTDGVIVNYPNNLLANSIITNFSFEDKPVRVRVRFQVNYDADVDAAMEAAKRAIEGTGKVLPDTTEIVVRSLWDDSRGHMLSGILLEGRYRIADVRHRTRIRSEVLRNLAKALTTANIPLASPRVRIEQVT
ncbi:MAG: mechanosensitive ion channel [Akkermansiaceae bacterium]|nr:mechanosensitive ion channel [Akkermansiaceae bacterium]NNM28236.1 mechanosensitive ion channel [Akkermansiaceae bacterium]